MSLGKNPCCMECINNIYCAEKGICCIKCNKNFKGICGILEDFLYTR